MDEKTVAITRIQGRRAIYCRAFTHLNPKYHAPYLAKIGGDGEPIWQDKLYDGYSKLAEIYYAIDGLQSGDIIKAAGGSGGNKYPYTAEIVEMDDETLTVRPMSTQEFDNFVADLKKLTEEEGELSEREKLILRRKILRGEIEAINQKLETL